MTLLTIPIIYISVAIALWLYRFRDRRYTIQKMKDWQVGNYEKFDWGGRTDSVDVIFATTIGSIIWPFSLVIYVGKKTFGKLPSIVPPDRDEDYENLS